MTRMENDPMIFGVFLIGGAMTAIWLTAVLPSDFRQAQALDPLTTALIGGCCAVIGYLLPLVG